MKKLLCILGVVSILLLGSIAALADPYGKPDTEVPTMINPPVKLLLSYSSK